MSPCNDRGAAGLWLTDFDGTIKPSAGPVPEMDKMALRKLGALGWRRAVATGRSLFAFVKEWEPGLDFDYLIFSSGVGVCSWSGFGPGGLLSSAVLSPVQAARAVSAARVLGYGFFAFQAPPDNHHFFYHSPGQPPGGFTARLEIYACQAEPWETDFFAAGPPTAVAHLLIMIPEGEIDQAQERFEELSPGLSLGRSTSPFNDGCLWLEVYPPGVSKGLAAANLAASLGLGPERAVALGNDYNDLDLLAWAGRAFVAADAPMPLLDLYPAMPPAGQGGLAWVFNHLRL